MLLSCSNDMVNETSNQKEKTSGDISKEEATLIANKFIKAQGLFPQTRSNLPLEIVYTNLDAKIKTRSNVSSEKPAYYIINIGNKGYVIVSGSDITFPVLGYSTESSFDINDIPINMAEVLLDYENTIVQVKKQNIKPTQEISNMRASYLSPSPNTRASATVGPLLGTIKWNQSPYYNAYCPSGCPVGCVATATCQIMKFWEYPSQGEGYHSYSSGYGTLSFDYDYPLVWSNMPKATLTGPNKDAAKLSYGVAVALDMGFSPQGSGTYQTMVPGVLKKYYKYPSTVHNISKSSGYSYSSWSNILIKELDAGRPIQYAGSGNGGGHSFVCDGYADNGYFHYNWGWGGKSDGYFMHTALNPGSLGTGGGSGGFNYSQTIVAGFAPPNGGNGGGGGDDPTPTPTPTPDPGTDDYGYYPESKALYARTTYIKSISVNSLSNATKGDTGGFNYFKSKTLTLNSNSTYTITLTPGFISDSFKEYWKAWIDFNGNNRFDSDEVILQETTTGYSSVTAKFKVPYTSGTGLRMRVSMKWGGYATSTETFKHGEVEDYNVTIK